MAKRNPLKAKVHAANVRECTINARELRDDGHRRRLNTDPLTVAETRAKSRKRKVWVSANQRWRTEMFIRAHKGAEWATLREQFIPIASLRPSKIKGLYQSTKEG